MIKVHLTEEPIDLHSLLDFVADARAGAISTFVGTTRDSFDGHSVVKLEYEAYQDMALKYMRDLATSTIDEFVGVLGVAIEHRLGEVAIGQISVAIAVSSAHRKAAIHAVEHVIDQLKLRCPIWKKEVYGDGHETVWKQQ